MILHKIPQHHNIEEWIWFELQFGQQYMLFIAYSPIEMPAIEWQYGNMGQSITGYRGHTGFSIGKSITD